MAYSAAYWTSEADDYTLADAQRDKLELICRKLGLGPGARLLDMGCGWGSLTVYAAQQHQVRVTAVTLSAQQGAHVAGGSVTSASATWSTSGFRTTGTPAAALTTPSPRWRWASTSARPCTRGSVPSCGTWCAPLAGSSSSRCPVRPERPVAAPFIESYIAPDMHMRPVGETIALLEKAGLEVTGAEAMREHYVRTIHAWQDNFEARQDQIGALLTAEQVRVWRLYLAGGALAFADGRMGVHQLLAIRR